VSFWSAIIFQFFFVLTVAWLIVRGQERAERNQLTTDHILRGLSRAMWFDLANRPNADTFVKLQANKILSEMDAEEVFARQFTQSPPDPNK
jgi:hypothetical protein